MLYPVFEELLKLRHQAQGLGVISAQTVQTPLSGLYASVFRGQGMDFDEVREYRYGDEIRNIDWRVTARMRKPYLKVYREERERNVLLCVDCGPHMQFGTRQTFKSVQAGRIAALLGWSAQAHGDRVGGLVFGNGPARFFRPNSSQRSFWQLLRSLSTPAEPKVNTPDTPLLQALTLLNRSANTGALLFLIADFSLVTIDDLRQTLSRLSQRHELVIITLDDPADHTLPPLGTVNFLTVDGTQVTFSTDSNSGRAAYHAVWTAHRQALKQLLQQLHISLINISTDDNAHQSLMHGLRARSHQQLSHR